MFLPMTKKRPSRTFETASLQLFSVINYQPPVFAISDAGMAFLFTTTDMVFMAK